MSDIDEHEIDGTVRRYVAAMSTADEQALRAAFHPAASIVGNYRGAVE